MKIITSQHISTLKTLIDNGIYYCDYISDYHKATPLCYKRLKDKLESKIGGGECYNPIFGWSKVFDNTPLEYNEKNRKRMNEMTPLNDIVYTLEVPDELVLLTAFYYFVDCRCFEDDPDTFPEFTSLEDLQWDETVFDVSKTIEIQAIIPYIKLEWVEQINFVNRKKDNS